jgi:hypothetical protein
MTRHARAHHLIAAGNVVGREPAILPIAPEITRMDASTPSLKSIPAAAVNVLPPTRVGNSFRQTPGSYWGSDRRANRRSAPRPVPNRPRRLEYSQVRGRRGRSDGW